MALTLAPAVLFLIHYCFYGNNAFAGISLVDVPHNLWRNKLIKTWLLFNKKLYIIIKIIKFIIG